MQVLMPMSAPVAMPMSEQNGFSYSNVMGHTTMHETVSQYSWSADGIWFNSGGYLNLEHPPQQVPMEGSEGFVDREAHFERKEKILPQADMDTVASALASVAIGAGALRRRRAKGQSTDVCQSQAFSEREDVFSSQVDSTETDYAQELANTLLTQLQIGGTERQSALTEFESLCFANEATSRAVQLALKQASSCDSVALAKAALRGNVRSAVQSKHANFVLQTIIEVTPPACASFIVDELMGFARKAARQQFGCRVLCRLLEHLPTSDNSSFIHLFDEILAEDVNELCCNEFGSYVARHLLEFGLPQHKHEIVNALRTDVLGYSKDKFGSHVMETALRHSSQEDRHDLARHLMRNQSVFVELAGSQFGRHVARALLSMHGEIKREAVEMLLPMESKLRSMRYGKSIVQCLRTAAKCSGK